MDKSKAFTILAKVRANVVTAFKSQALSITAFGTGDGHTINLRTASTIGSKYNGSPIGRKVRFGINAGTFTQPLQATPIRIDQEYLRTALSSQYNSQLFTIRRPGRRTVAAFEAGYRPAFTRG